MITFNDVKHRFKPRDVLILLVVSVVYMICVLDQLRHYEIDNWSIASGSIVAFIIAMVTGLYLMFQSVLNDTVVKMPVHPLVRAVVYGLVYSIVPALVIFILQPNVDVLMNFKPLRVVYGVMIWQSVVQAIAVYNENN